MTAVVPGRDCERTVRACLDALLNIAQQPGSALGRVLFVDDGSQDDTRAIVSELASACDTLELVTGHGKGAGSARNLGWRESNTSLVWFVDSDCVAHPEALSRLMPLIDDERVGAVGGSYGIADARSVVARVIHEEIIARHAVMQAMGPEVDFLATFNVVYRRDALERTGGFDERYLKGQDAELAFRVREAGYTLRFTNTSLVDHYHADRLSKYLRVQRQQGFWRAPLHARHRGYAAKNSYSSALDHAQPLFAAAALGFAGVLVVVWVCVVSGILPLIALFFALLLALGHFGAVAMTTLPMTRTLMRRTGKADMAWAAPIFTVRAFWRAIGAMQGVLWMMFSRDAKRGFEAQNATRETPAR